MVERAAGFSRARVQLSLRGRNEHPHHGARGEWRVSKQRLRWDILDAFAEAAEQAGFARIPDFNTGDNAGVSYFDVNQRGGFRVSSAKAFLKPARARANLTVWTHAMTERLQFEREPNGVLRCSGATLIHDGQRVRVRAAREVILSAGAIGTPQLLQLSGIGPASLLREHGVEVLLDSPGVGANLQDHLQIRPVFKVRGVRTLNVLASSFWGRLAIGLEYALRRTGPMSMAPSQLGAFVRSDPARVHANLQYHVQPLSLRAYDQPPDTFPAFTASVCNLNPESRGTRAHSQRQRGRSAAHRAQLPVDGRGPARRGRVAARHAAHRRAAGAGAVFPRRAPAGRAVPDRRRTGARRRAHRQHHLSPGGHGAHGRRVRPGGGGR